MSFLRSSLLLLLASMAPALHAQSLAAMPDVTYNGGTGLVTSFAVSGDTLYIGGLFDTVDGSSRSNLAAINLNTGHVTAWDPGASGSVAGIGLSNDGSTLYVGGSFTSLGGQSRNYLGAVSTASGSATAWAPDPNNWVTALTVNKATGNVFALGDFTQASGASTTANQVMGVTASGTVTGYGGSTSFVGSDYRSIATSTDGSTLYIAHIGGKSWDAAGGGSVTRWGVSALETSDFLATAFNPSPQEATFASPGQSLAVHGNSLYIGGQFNNIGGVSNTTAGTDRARLAKFDMNADGSDGTLDTTFATINSASGPNSGGTRGLVFIGNKLFVVGGFTNYAGSGVGGVALVDPNTGAIDSTYNVTTSSSLFGANPTYTYGDSTNGYLFISANGISGATVLGATQTNNFVALSTPSVVPEPTTYAAIFGCAALGFVVWQRRRRPVR